MDTNMSGRIVLVTGATAGIGKQAALGLAKQGARLVLVGRNEAKAAAAVAELSEASGNRDIEYMLADLSSMQSIRQLAETFAKKYDRLHVLLNNAGGVNTTRQTTADGFELTFALNHLSYFLLTQLLLPQLEKGGPSRIVNVSSSAHAWRPFDFDDVMAEKGYFGWFQYGRSKLANILFTREQAKRLVGKPITVNCLHPGFVASSFLEKGGVWKVIGPVANLFALSETSGARTSIWLASSPEPEGVSGKYFVKRRERQPSPAALDDAAAARLWQLSEQLTEP